MPRPRLEPGEVGVVRFETTPQGVTARARTRTAAGDRVQVRGTGATEVEARAAFVARARTAAYDAAELSPETPFSVLLDEWLRDRARVVRPQTARTYADVARWLGALCGALPISAFTVARIRKILDDVERRRSPGARKQARGALQGALDVAVLAEAIPANPARSLPRERARRNLPRALSVDQVDVLLRLAHERAARSEKSLGRAAAHALPRVLEVGLGTGLRISEICALRNRDVDLENCTLAVTGTLVDDENYRPERQDELKTRGQARTIRFAEFVRRPLRAARADQETVPARLPDAPAIGGRAHNGRVAFLRPRVLRATLATIREHPDFVTALAVTGLVPADVTPHILRRTAATLLAVETNDLTDAQRLLGHADVRVTRSAYAGAAWVQTAAAESFDAVFASIGVGWRAAD